VGDTITPRAALCEFPSDSTPTGIFFNGHPYLDALRPRAAEGERPNMRAFAALLSEFGTAFAVLRTISDIIFQDNVLSTFRLRRRSTLKVPTKSPQKTERVLFFYARSTHKL